MTFLHHLTLFFLCFLLIHKKESCLGFTFSLTSNNHAHLDGCRKPRKACNSISMISDSNGKSDDTPISQLRRDLFLAASILSIPCTFAHSTSANAAPPIAVIAEELGYFPVTNRNGDLQYIPKRVKRKSSDQAIQLAQELSNSGAVMYGAYWCPHCARQKELFGKEAWDLIPYVECAPKGYGANANLCLRKNVDGYPTWSLGKKGKSTLLGGERPLEELAQEIGFTAFNPQLEENVPLPLGSSQCR